MKPTKPFSTTTMPAKAAANATKRGFTLVAMAVMILCMFSLLALAFDLGRVYLGRNEAQTFTDSASLDATFELDGTPEGILRAQQRVTENTNKWNFSTEGFGSVMLMFARSKEGPWEISVLDPTGYRYARVSATIPVPLTFFPVSASTHASANPLPNVPMGMILLAGGAGTMSVAADSRSGQEPRDSFKEGLLPFSPFAHNMIAPHFGLNVGTRYTLRWAANPRISSGNTCIGDRLQSMIDLAQAGGGDERGYIEQTSASIIRDSIVFNYQSVTRTIGDPVDMTGGAKQTILDALTERVLQDSDTSSVDFATYVTLGLGNGRRLVGVPINTGYPTYRIVQIGAFLLPRVNEFTQGGNQPICAEYVGAWLQGGKHKAAAPAGAYVARLIQ